MSVLGKKLRGLEGGRVAFICPGCREMHHVTVDGSRGWSYNGDPDAPTFSPSVLVRGKQIQLDERGEWTGEWILGADGKPLPMVCHSFVKDGRIQYLGDCTHALAGQTVDLPDVEDVMS